MSPEESDLWGRADTALATASRLVDHDPDAAASRAYYAAFYAIQAVFSVRGQTYSRHKAVEVAVHRDLVKAGVWSEKLGADFSLLVNLRHTADYGGRSHVGVEQARESVERARRVVQAARKLQREPSLP